MRNTYFFILLLFLGILSHAQNGLTHLKLATPDTTCSITIPDTTGVPGDTILIPVRVRNFNNLGAIGLYITYNNTVLRYLNIVNINSSLAPMFNENNGVIMFSWMTFFMPLSIGNTKLFDIKFIYNGGNSDINFDLTKSDITDMNTMSSKYTVWNNGGIYQCPAPYPVASFTYDGDPMFCEGESLVLNADINSDYKYKWFKDDAFITGQTKTSYTATTTGNYQLQVTNSHNCSAISDYLSVVVEPLPAIQSTTEIPVCGSGSVNLNAVSTGGKIYWYNSENGGTPSGTGKTYTTPVLTTTTTYFVEAVSKGCTSPDRVAVVAKVYPLPTASVTPSGTNLICAGTSIQLKAASAAGYSYQWLSNGVAVSGATSSALTVNSQNNYSVIVSDNNNCMNTSNTVVVNVSSLPSAAISAGGQTTICQGENLLLTGNTGTGLSYQWRKSNVNISGATASAYNANLAGDYTLVVTNAGSCSNTSNKITVTVTANPAATITPQSALTFCSGGNVTLKANTGTGLSWQWKKDGYFISNATTSSYTTDKSGTYALIVSNSNGCSATSSNVTVTVNSPPIPSVTAKSATTFCQGNSVVIAANTGSNITYKWQKDNVDISGATSTSFTANASGTYHVIEVNEFNCSATSSNISVTVNPVPNAVISGPSVVCSGTNGIDLVAPNVAGYTYQWRRNSVNLTGATNYTYTNKASGTFSVNITNSYLCSAVSNDIVVSSYTTPAALISASGSTTFCQGGAVTLSTSSGTGYTYQWKKAGVPLSGATNSAFTLSDAQVSESGSYSAVITNVSCSNSTTAVTITVNALPAATITQGASLSICLGSALSLSANTGTGLTYKWKKNNVFITGATSINYQLSTTNANDAAAYSVQVSNANCANTSSAINVSIIALPSATVSQGASVAVCQGAALTLSANSGTGLTYQWKKNNTNITGATSINYQLSTTNSSDAGNYSVQVANSGCSAISANTAVTVNTLPLATISQGSSVTVCQGSALNLSAFYSAGYTYQWKKNNTNITGATTTNYQLSTTNSSDAAAYSVQVSNANCSNTSAAITVTVNPLPTASISQGSSLALCEGSALNLSANSGTGLTYQWKKNNTNITSATTINYQLSTINAADAAAYSVQVSNGTCSNTSSNINVTVNPLPTASISQGTSLALCEGSALNLSANSGTGLTYQWKKNNSTIAGATSINYQLSIIYSSDAAAYSVLVSNGTCSNTSLNINVTVNALPAATISQGSSLALCEGSSLNLSANSGTGFTYQWKKNNTNLSGATSINYQLSTINAAEAGSYSVQVSNGTCSNTSSNIIVTVNPLPVIDLGPDKNISAHQSLSLSVSAGFTSYQWFKDGIILQGATTSNYELQTTNSTDAGRYSVLVTNASGCSAYAYVNVTVSTSSTFKVDGILTYDNSKASVLSNVKIVLKNSEGAKIDSVLTDSYGHFLFNNVSDGNYSLNAYISKKWGGADPRDGLMINKYFVGIINSFATPLRKSAADVNADSKVNATDGLLINKRFVLSISSFKAGDWLANTQNITVAGADLNKNFNAICVGDADGSYSPPAKKISNVSLITDGYIEISNSSLIEIPVKAATDMQIGALGLIFNFPADLDIKEIRSAVTDLVYNFDSNSLALAWSALREPLNIKSGETLFTIVINAGKSLASSPDTKLLDLSASSIVSDIDANDISFASFSVPALIKRTTSNGQLSATSYQLKNYPNPFSNFTTIEYTLPEPAMVTISIYNLFGQKVSELANVWQEKGTHSICQNLSVLPSGIFMYKLETRQTPNPVILQNFMILNK